MVSILSPGPVADVHGKRKKFKKSPCRLQLQLQGSCLEPVEFITYTESVASVFGRHNINHHPFADDKQAYASTQGVDDVRGRPRDCTSDISNWCASRRL